MEYFDIFGVAAIIVAMLIIPQLQYRKSKNKEAYHAVGESF